MPWTVALLGVVKLPLACAFLRAPSSVAAAWLVPAAVVAVIVAASGSIVLAAPIALVAAAGATYALLSPSRDRPLHR